MENTTKDIVVLLSGGIDSTVLLHSLANGERNIHALCMYYGQRHQREQDCARRQAALVGAASFHILNMGVMGEFLRSASSLIQGGPPVPALETLSETDRTQPPTYVPNRNMMLLSVAAAYAESMGATEVYYGAQAQDEYGYWDCTAAFLEKVNAVLALNRRNAVQVKAPLIRCSKAENIRLGLELGVDFSQTWSCYQGESLACGICPTCVERLQGFAANHQTDPLLYVRAEQ